MMLNLFYSLSKIWTNNTVKTGVGTIVWIEIGFVNWSRAVTNCYFLFLINLSLIFWIDKFVNKLENNVYHYFLKPKVMYSVRFVFSSAKTKDVQFLLIYDWEKQQILSLEKQEPAWKMTKMMKW